MSYMDRLADIAQRDVEVLRQKDAEYGSSWKKRGGAGSYFMVARKFDRLENAVKILQYDIFEAIRHDPREEGVLDDIRDLRRYLLLIEAEVLERAKPSGQEHPFGYDAEQDT